MRPLVRLGIALAGLGTLAVIAESFLQTADTDIAFVFECLRLLVEISLKLIAIALDGVYGCGQSARHYAR